MSNSQLVPELLKSCKVDLTGVPEKLRPNMSAPKPATLNHNPFNE